MKQVMKFRITEGGVTGDWYKATNNATDGWKLPFWATGDNIELVEVQLGYHFDVNTVIKVDDGSITIIGQAQVAFGRYNSNRVIMWPVRRAYDDNNGKQEAVNYAFYSEETLVEYLEDGTLL